MSSKKKNQHFVARHYLRHFCFDGANLIRILTVACCKYIPQSGLKGQCARAYFYHTDPGVEEMLSGLEEVAEELFRRMINEHWLPADTPTKNDVLTVLNVMRLRTEMFNDQTRKQIETCALEWARLYAEAKNKEVLKYLPYLRVEISHWPMHGLRSALTTTMLLSDLHLKLLVPPQGAHFLTSDHPVVLLNQAFTKVVPDRNLGGLANRGIQLFLPLSPDLMLIAFDPVCYRVGRPDRNVVQIERHEDVDLINALQILNANQCLYFCDDEDLPRFRSLLTKFRNKRPSVNDLIDKQKIIENGREGSLIAINAPVTRHPGIWSFCKTRHQFVAADFGLRDPEMVRLHAEYSEDCRKRSTLLGLGEWFAERTANANLQQTG